MEQQQALFPSCSTLNLTTGRSRASHFDSKRLETGFLSDCGALWRVFLATFGILPVLAAPMPCCQLAGRLGVALMPSPKASAPVWIALLDSHLGIAVSNGLAFTALAGTHYELLWSSRCTPWAVAGQFSRIHHLPHRSPKRQESSPEAIVVPSGGPQRSLTAS